MRRLRLFPKGRARGNRFRLMLLGRYAGFPNTFTHSFDLLWVVEHNCPVVQPNPARRNGRHALTTPDVEAEVMMVAARRHECGGAGYESHKLEAEHVAVEGETPLEVSDVQVEVPDPQTGSRCTRRLLAGDGGQQAVEVQRLWATARAAGRRPARCRCRRGREGRWPRG